MITVQNVNKFYKKKQVLYDISLEIKDGECIGFVGHNGSGKSVLLKIISGYSKASSGFVRVDGIVIRKQTQFIKDMGIVIETPNFLNNLSGYHNLKLLADIRGEIDDDRIHEVLVMMGLEKEMKKPVKHYSLGMKQKLRIAQAIMEPFTYLILDEPMNGLDSDAVTCIRNVLIDIKKQGKTILITSHIQEDIDLLCDRMYYCKKGRIQSEKE